MATTFQMQAAPLVVPVQLQLPQQPANLNTVKKLAFVQLVIGILTTIFGIAATASLISDTASTITGAGIWAGGWITVTGIIGVIYGRNYINMHLNAVYMAFSIISTCVSTLAGLFVAVSVTSYAIADRGLSEGDCQRDPWENDCNYKNVGLGLHVPLLIFMIVEFFVSIIVAVFSCQNCCQNCCRRHIHAGVVIHQQPYVPVVTTSGCPTVMTSGGYPSNVVQYPAQMVPQYGVQMAPQYGPQIVPQYDGQMAPQYGGQMQPQYSIQVPPPYDDEVGGAQQPGVSPYPVQQTNVTCLEKPTTNT